MATKAKACSAQAVDAYVSTRVYNGIRIKTGSVRDAHVTRVKRSAEKATQHSSTNASNRKFG